MIFGDTKWYNTMAAKINRNLAEIEGMKWNEPIPVPRQPEHPWILDYFWQYNWFTMRWNFFCMPNFFKLPEGIKGIPYGYQICDGRKAV